MIFADNDATVASNNNRYNNVIYQSLHRHQVYYITYYNYL